MQPKAHTLNVTKTAHYYTNGMPGNETRFLLFVCHGYAQKADIFLQSLDALNPQEYYIVAPEGFSRFYRKGFQGEVVASWMTSADRLTEISDYIQFLQQLYEQEVKRLNPAIKIILLGFSQGATTIWRWISAKQPNYHLFINWAGWIAEDIDYNDLNRGWKNDSLLFLYGNSDPFLPVEKVQELKNRCIKYSIPFEFLSFNGIHAIDSEVLTLVLNSRFNQQCP